MAAEFADLAHANAPQATAQVRDTDVHRWLKERGERTAGLDYVRLPSELGVLIEGVRRPGRRMRYACTVARHG